MQLALFHGWDWVSIVYRNFLVQFGVLFYTWNSCYKLHDSESFLLHVSSQDALKPLDRLTLARIRLWTYSAPENFHRYEWLQALCSGDARSTLIVMLDTPLISCFLISPNAVQSSVWRLTNGHHNLLLLYHTHKHVLTPLTPSFARNGIRTPDVRT